MKNRLFLLGLVAALFLNNFSFASEYQDESNVWSINQNINELFGKENYYSKSPSLVNHIKVSGTDQDVYLVVYNYQGKSTSDVKVLGITKEGTTIENPAALWNYFDGTKINELQLVENPWNKPDNVIDMIKKVSGLDVSKRTKFTRNSIKEDYLRKDFPNAKYLSLEKNIQDGLDLVYGGITGSAKVPSLLGSEVGNQTIYKASTKPPSGNWSDYVMVVSPPSWQAWGVGYVIFESGITNGETQYSYFTVPIAPFSITPTPTPVPKNDLQVTITGKSDEVYSEGFYFVTAKVKNLANVDETQTTDLEWKVNGVAVKTVPNLTIKDEKNVSLNLEAPASGQLNIEVSVNNSKSVPETNYSNNIASTTLDVLPDPPETEGNINIEIQAPDNLTDTEGFGISPIRGKADDYYADENQKKFDAEWNYIVRATWNWAQTYHKEKRYDSYNDRYYTVRVKDNPPSTTLNLVSTVKGKKTISYDVDSQSNTDVEDINQIYNQSINIKANDPKEIRFRIPFMYMYWEDQNAVISANVTGSYSTSHSCGYSSKIKYLSGSNTKSIYIPGSQENVKVRLTQ